MFSSFHRTTSDVKNVSFCQCSSVVPLLPFHQTTRTQWVRGESRQSAFIVSTHIHLVENIFRKFRFDSQAQLCYCRGFFFLFQFWTKAFERNSLLWKGTMNDETVKWSGEVFVSVFCWRNIRLVPFNLFINLEARQKLLLFDTVSSQLNFGETGLNAQCICSKSCDVAKNGKNE